MEKLVVALLLYSCLAMSCVYGATVPESDANQWLYRVTEGKMREKMTHIKIYMQETYSGPNASVVAVAQAPQANNSATMFGTVSVIDNLLTETPDPELKPVGRAQGFVSFSSKDEFAFLEAVEFFFTAGKFNGSSLTVLGRNQLHLPVREISIVGGTGVFRMARGFVITTTYYLNPSITGVLVYDFYAIHFDTYSVESV